MELDEFKAAWKKKTENQNLTPTEKENLKSMNMNVTETISKLNEKTLRWATINRNTSSMLIGVIGVAVLIHLFLPPELNSLKNSIPALVILGLFGAGGLWLSKESQKIFDPSPSDLQSSIKATIKKWNRWYAVSNCFLILFLPIVFYLSLSMVLKVLHLQLSLATQAWIVIIATALNLIFSHWYYSKNYISKIKELKESMKELE